MKSPIRKRTRSASIDSVSMTPMIDVVFQLLIYFVLTFEIPDQLSQMPIWRPGPPPTDAVTPPPLPPNIRIGVRLGFYTLNDQVVSLSELEKVFNRLADLDPEQNMLVLTSEESKHRDLVSLLDRLSKAGLTQVSLLSTQ
jgi:biopolymer transport protein ExbD